MIPIIISFLVLITTSYTDIKENIIPNKHLIIALILGIVWVTLNNSFMPSLLHGFIALIIFYILYKIKVFCEGDAKLLTIICFLNPSIIFIFIIFILSGIFLGLYGFATKTKHSFYAPFVLISYTIITITTILIK